MHYPFYIGLNKLIKKCDKRISAKKTTKHGFVRKERKAGVPSKQEVPENAPLWAVNRSLHLKVCTNMYSPKFLWY